MKTLLERADRLAVTLLALCVMLGGCGKSVTPVTLTGDGGVVLHLDASSPRDVQADTTKVLPDSGGCGHGKLVCGGLCVDPSADDGNCGRCGNICGAGLVCASGLCACPSGFSFCNGLCVDTQTDSNNCGACDNACPAGIPCGGGMCGCGGPTVLCGGDGGAATCTNVSNDPLNCGSCGNVCPAGLSCVPGEGGTKGSCACPAGQSYCIPPGQITGSCVDTTGDPNNCGGCNMACDVGQACVESGCACGATQHNCAGIGCVDLSTDPNHCGRSCPGSICASPLTCQNATCTCPSATETYCRSTNTCTDLTSDPANCGACGAACDSGSCTNKICSNPLACVFPFGTCAAPYTCQANNTCGCDSSTPTYCAASNTCVDTTSDPENCGSCGHSCNGGTCANSTCQAATTCTLANNAACTPGAAAPNCCIPGPGVSCASTETAFGTATTGSTFANLCCIAGGQPCNTTTDGTCCGYMVCNGTTCACQPNGHHCVNNGDCCAGAVCFPQHICGQTCVLSTVGCELGDTCCAAGTTNPGAACPATGVCP